MSSSRVWRFLCVLLTSRETPALAQRCPERATHTGPSLVIERPLRSFVLIEQRLSNGRNNTAASRLEQAYWGRNFLRIRSCYERALRNNPALVGRVEVQLRSQNRSVTANFVSRTLAAPEAVACMHERMNAIPAESLPRENAAVTLVVAFCSELEVLRP